MLSNREKMVAISSSTNEWPQNHQIDEKNLMASTTRRTEKVPGQEIPQQQQQQPLNCPRCDSSNTKFCYYNNYSLSQPRHFCKACKRYWTRGGTLRNVPVGGGCRKNKRVVKRPASASNSIDGSSSSTSSAAANPNNPHAQRQIDIINPLLLYGLSTNPSDMNLPFSSYNNSRISTTFDTLLPGYDLQPHQLNALGLGFSSGLVMSNDAAGDGNYRNGFNHTSSNNSLLSSYPFFIGSSSSSSPTTASLLASSLLHQQKFNNNGCVIKSTQTPSHLNNVASFEQIQMTANGGEAAARIGMKEVKAEERGGGQSRIMNWNQMEQIGGLPDPAATLYWNTNSVGAWHDDPSNVGSSVTSLI